MQQKKTARKKIPSIKKYDMGYFVDPNTAAANKAANISGGFAAAGLAGSTLASFQGQRRQSAGLGAASGALSGAATGAMIGSTVPVIGTVIGGAVGAVAGGISGLVGANKKNKQIAEQEQIQTNNTLQQVNNSAIKNNVNPYGTQMYADGDFVLDDPGDPPKKKKVVPVIPVLNVSDNLKYNEAGTALAPNYTPTDNPDIYMGKFGVPLNRKDYNASGGQGYEKFNSFEDWADYYGGWQKPPATPPLPPTTRPNLSDKARGLDNNYNPARYQSTTEEIKRREDAAAAMKATHNPNNYYSHFEKGGLILDGNPDNQAEGSAQVNTQQNVINIQKGELLIDPTSGKILQEYKGVNPLTGGIFEPHAKGKKKESDHNFTLADPGLFVITKKTAKQYKDAVDTNDKISQKTVLMNIRNAKIEKEGGLKGTQMVNPEQTNYAFGDTIQSSGDPGQGLQYVNVPQWNPMQPPIQQPNYQTLSAVNPNGLSGSSVPTMPQPVVNNKLNTTFNPVPSVSGSKFNINNGLDILQKYGPAFMNLGQGIFGQTQIQPYANPTNNPYRDQVIANMPKDIDMTPIINDIRSSADLMDKNLLNTTNNAAVYRANKQQLNTNTNKALVNARLGAQDANNRVASQRSAIYNNLGQQDQQDQQMRREYDFKVDDINARRGAAKQNLINTGVEQLQQVGMNDKANTKKQNLDKYSLDLLKQIFPNTKYYNEFQVDYVNKLLKGQ